MRRQTRTHTERLPMTAPDLLDDLRWRGMVQDTTADADKKLAAGPITVYVGFDPTAPSLQIGNLVPIMLLTHFQRAGHKPIALVGGATGMVGDPSGKSEERVLQSIDSIRANADRFKTQLRKFLAFEGTSNAAEMVDNYDWFREFGLLDFLRDVGKHLTVTYMMAKDSVQQRLQAGLSFTEFSYQLLQGYDFYWLYTNKNCTFQAGGSDQWGNITAGTELVRRMCGGEAHALTCPLLTKADGTKFGKTAAGERIWLDASMTSPYRFYQFWLNCADDDAVRFVKIFSLSPREELEPLIAQHQAAPHTRILQKALAREMTTRIHSEEECRKAIDASEILFGGGTTEMLAQLSEADLFAMFEGVPRSTVARSEIDAGVGIVDFLSEKTGIFPSKGEAKRMLQSGGVSVNKAKVSGVDVVVTGESLLSGKYVLVQKGKKNYHLVVVEG